MPDANAPNSSYDLMPYPARPFVETHPARLAATGTLFGIQVPPVDRCRVLELGCARGGNVIPMAEQLPNSEFVAIDRSDSQIAEARRLARRIAVNNIEFHTLDILDFDARFGEFDYILCHGVFSWVGRAVQDKLLEICANRLSPHGVAYVSYNTYPGWHTRGMVRDMMYYRASRFADPQTRVRAAREMLDFLVQSTPQDTPYGILLRSEAEILRHKEDGYLFHDELEEINTPCYFAHFAGRAAAAGLQYLAEADISTMWSRNLPPAVAGTLERMATDLIQREQYIDFVRYRGFRQTLLCHRQLPVDRELRPDGLGRLFVAAPLAPVDAPSELRSPFQTKFRHLINNRGIVTDLPLWKGAMLHLSEVWPASVSVSELAELARTRARIERTNDPDALHRNECLLGKLILELNLSGLAELRATPPRLCVQSGDRPIASALARVQAMDGKVITNLRHENVFVGDLVRRLLPELDGSNNRSMLLNKASVLNLPGCGSALSPSDPHAQKNGPNAQLAKELDEALDWMARSALLTA